MPLGSSKDIDRDLRFHLLTAQKIFIPVCLKSGPVRCPESGAAHLCPFPRHSAICLREPICITKQLGRTSAGDRLALTRSHLSKFRFRCELLRQRRRGLWGGGNILRRDSLQLPGGTSAKTDG